jgi:predicted double-glycine peptidase
MRYYNCMEEDIQSYNLACGSAWVQNLISNFKGGTYTEGVLRTRR